MVPDCGGCVVLIIRLTEPEALISGLPFVPKTLDANAVRRLWMMDDGVCPLQQVGIGSYRHNQQHQLRQQQAGQMLRERRPHSLPQLSGTLATLVQEYTDVAHVQDTKDTTEHGMHKRINTVSHLPCDEDQGTQQHVQP